MEIRPVGSALMHTVGRTGRISYELFAIANAPNKVVIRKRETGNGKLTIGARRVKFGVDMDHTHTHTQNSGIDAFRTETRKITTELFFFGFLSNLP